MSDYIQLILLVALTVILLGIVTLAKLLRDHGPFSMDWDGWGVRFVVKVPPLKNSKDCHEENS